MSGPGRAVVVLVTVIWSVTACAMPGTDDPGCGECVEELASVRAEILALADVQKIISLKKYPSSPTAAASVNVELKSRSVGDPAVADEVARIVWQSRLEPVVWVDVTVVDSAGDLVDTNSPFEFLKAGDDYETYLEDWGPRPVDPL